jgi:pimeloyl-ACP methyl ester carboxylesterase
VSHLRLDNIHLMGVSLGGFLAQLYAEKVGRRFSFLYSPSHADRWSHFRCAAYADACARTK